MKIGARDAFESIARGRKSTFKVEHSHGLQVVSGWQETSVYLHVSLSTRLLDYLHDMTDSFPQSKWSKR